MQRTSPSQFEVLIEFMERNGDLNKPAAGPEGRQRAHRLWTELTKALNLDATGSSKPIDKWKKVWSDLKNHTKRKAAKINHAARGTGGGPACTLVLSDLEQRVLTIIGTQAATGLNLEEAGLEFFKVYQRVDTPGSRQDSGSTSVDVQIESPVVAHVSPSRDGRSPQGTLFVPTPHRSRSPQRRSTHHSSTRRRTPIRSRATRPSAIDQATERFLVSDERWLEVANEFLRQRSVELEQQARWQVLFEKFLDVLENFSNK